jgi:hypothetical protein
MELMMVRVVVVVVALEKEVVEVVDELGKEKMFMRMVEVVVVVVVWCDRWNLN